MNVRHAVVVAMLTAALVLSASAFASTATVTPSSAPATQASVPATSAGVVVSPPTTITPEPRTTPSRTASATYDLSWTLPTAGKSGCTVCHSDVDLVRVQSGQTVSLYVNTEILEQSAHKGVPCTGCHIDFAYKVPHANVTQDGQAWRATAKAACKNCHSNSYADYTSSAHSPSGTPGDASATVGAPDSSAPGMPKPLCGDCHGGHSIPASNNVEAVNALHLSGLEMCGKCHTKITGSYNDYYHGSAYKMGAPDAPACWDCHGTHRVLPASDRDSTVHEDRVIETCRECHADPRDGYIGYRDLVHGKQAVLDANPVYSVIKSAQEAVGSAFGSFKELFKKGD
ncbi:MAG: hypothetical protein HGB10_05575 [Coriobacteriia bacterium]|nr:hypothetical protein [Coriobacteriia bacterium]